MKKQNKTYNFTINNFNGADVYCISDIHLFQFKIWLFEYEARKRFFPNPLGYEELEDKIHSETSREFITDLNIRLLDYLKKDFLDFVALHNNDTKKVYFDLGDLFFELSDGKLKNIDPRLLKAIQDYYQTIKDAGYKRILLCWNHDRKALKKEITKSFYLQFFDEIYDDYFYYQGNGIHYLSHIPLLTWFFPEVRKHLDLDKEREKVVFLFLNEEYESGKQIIIHHGHIHSKAIHYEDLIDSDMKDFMLNKTKIINECLDYKLTQWI